MDSAFEIRKILLQTTESGLDALGYETDLTSLDPAQRDPVAYCRIWGDAAQGATSAWLKQSCEHRAIWGQFHCLPLEPSIERELIGKMTVAATGVRRLSHPERDVLLGSVQHHLALMHRATREYVSEAQWHREAFETYLRIGRVADANVARFLESVARAKQAVIDGDRRIVERSVEELLTVRREVMGIKAGAVHSFLVRNTGLDVWYISLMARIPYPEKIADEDHIRSLPESNHWRQFFEIIDVRRGGNAHSVRDAVTRYENAFPVMTSRSYPNPVLTAALIGAEARSALGEADAEQRRRAVASWIGPDGGLPIAIAKTWQIGTRLPIDG